MEKLGIKIQSFQYFDEYFIISIFDLVSLNEKLKLIENLRCCISSGSKLNQN